MEPLVRLQNVSLLELWVFGLTAEGDGRVPDTNSLSSVPRSIFTLQESLVLVLPLVLSILKPINLATIKLDHLKPGHG